MMWSSGVNNLPDLNFDNQFLASSEITSPFNSTEKESNETIQSEIVLVMEKCVHTMIKRHKIKILKRIWDL